MNSRFIFIVLALFSFISCNFFSSENSDSEMNVNGLYFPDEALGELFPAVQNGSVFPDYKTFVDCIPKMDPDTILANYLADMNQQGFSLKMFVSRHFELPPEIPESDIQPGSDMISHLKSHWPKLTRQSGKEEKYSSLISLPYPFVVPGGRFREMFYWDSYFTIIGLLESDEDELALGMIRNFAYLIDRFGYIPNGNRTYFLSRSQPPFFAEMLKAYAKKHGQPAISEFLPALEKEYKYWMKDAASVSKTNPVSGHSVRLEGGILNRYYGSLPTPRAEAFGKEFRWAQSISEDARPQFHMHLRAACESGWDFSTRWFADGKNKGTVETEYIIPVCLNSLLYNLEMQLGSMYKAAGDSDASEEYFQEAVNRKSMVDRYCWVENKGIYSDYHHFHQAHHPVRSLAMMYPLFFGLASQQQADAVAQHIRKYFLFDGGLVTTLTESGEQWDYPNGWAPLQWITVMGLDRYGHDELAEDIARRWLKLNEKVFLRDGKMMEKYNVIDTTLIAGGGEYANQDGFGWTNGVVLALDAWLEGKGVE